MRTFGWIVLVAGVALAGWWLWTRRRVGGVAYGQLLPPPPPPAGYVNPNDLYSAPGASWTDTAAGAFGTVNKVGISSICISQGGDPRQCELAGKVGGKVAEYGVKGTVKAASLAKKGLKKIIPFW